MTQEGSSALSGGQSADWIGTIAGNTRLHWAAFAGDRLLTAWDGPHLAATDANARSPLDIAIQAAPMILQAAIAARVSLYLASVVASQTRLLQRAYTPLHEVALEGIPLQGLYPTLGIDRALSLLGAGLRYGFPVLTIDGGTALTFTGADSKRAFAGGAILPGLTLQRQALARGTSALPEVTLPATLPERWAQGTPAAIASGISYGAIATIADFSRAWWQTYPQSAIVLTGGDGPLLWAYLQQQGQEFPELAAKSRLDPQLGWAGLLGTRRHRERSQSLRDR